MTDKSRVFEPEGVACRCHLEDGNAGGARGLTGMDLDAYSSVRLLLWFDTRRLTFGSVVSSPNLSPRGFGSLPAIGRVTVLLLAVGWEGVAERLSRETTSPTAFSAACNSLTEKQTLLSALEFPIGYFDNVSCL